MKRIGIIFLLCLCGLISKAQFVNTLTTGSNSTDFKSKGGLTADSVVHLAAIIFPDTTTANFSVASKYSGALIQVTGGQIWWRSLNPNQWHIFSSSTGGSYLLISDTANMMANHLKISDTTYMLSNRLKISDTAYLVSNRLKISDTAYALSNRLKISDTATAYSYYVRKSLYVNTNAPLKGAAALTGNLTLSIDTGRVSTQVITGGDLNKVRDSLQANISASVAGVSSFSFTTANGISGTVMSPTSTPNLTLTLNNITPASVVVSGNMTATNVYAGNIVKYLDTASMLSTRIKYSDTAYMLSVYLQKQAGVKYYDTSTMLSPYRRTTTKITNSDLANSTISGISLGSNLATLTFDTYLQYSSTSYNGSTAATISTNATPNNVGSTLMARDISGNVYANLFIGTLSGNSSSSNTTAITDNNSTNATYYPLWVTNSGGGFQSLNTSSSKITFNPSSGSLTTSTFVGALTGNATTASTLQTPRTINGVAFDGSANISISTASANYLNTGYGLTGTAYNGALTQTWTVDTTKIIAQTDTAAYYGVATKTFVRTTGASTFVPYTGATGAVNIGSNSFTAGAINGTIGIFNSSYTNTKQLQIQSQGNIPGISLVSSGNGNAAFVTNYIGANITSVLVGSGTNTPTTEVLRFDNTTGNTSTTYSFSANAITGNTTRFTSSGSDAGYAFYDRVNTSHFWLWYASGDIANLYNAGLGTNAVTFNYATNAAIFSSSVTMSGLTNNSTSLISGVNGNDNNIYLNGYNSGNVRITTNAGNSSGYNGISIIANNTGVNSLPSWALDLGGNNAVLTGSDFFGIGRKPNGGSYTTFFSIANTGATSFSNSVTASSFSGSGSGITGLVNSNLSGSAGITNANLANSSITINSTAVSLGGAITITANNPNSLTINNSGSGAASGSTYNGSSALTISYNTVGAQPLATNLTSLAGLSYASTSFVKMTAAGTFALDVNTYLTTSSASSTYVPYTGATGAVTLGSNSFTAGSGSFSQLATSSSSTSLIDLAITNSGANGVRFDLASTLTGEVQTWRLGTNFLTNTQEFGIYDVTGSVARVILSKAGALTLGSTSGTGTGSFYAGAGTFASSLTVASTTSLGGNTTITGTLVTSSSVTASSFSGSGSGITGLLNSNLSGSAGITNANLANSSITINSTAVSLGGAITITANNPNSLTINNSGSGAASGSTYNGSSALTISYNTVGAQPLATNLTSLAGLSYASTSFVKMTAAGTFALDVNTYLTTSSAASTYQPLENQRLSTSNSPSFVTQILTGTGSTTTLQLASANGVGSINWKNGSGTISWATYMPLGTNFWFRDMVNSLDLFGLVPNTGALINGSLSLSNTVGTGTGAFYAGAGTFASSLTVASTTSLGGNTTITGTLVTSSSVTASSFYNSSDIRLKNITNRYKTDNGFDFVVGSWKSDSTKQKHFWYIAQEVEKVYPFLVNTDGNGMKSVNYTELHTKEIYDLQKEVIELKKELIKLKSKLK